MFQMSELTRMDEVTRSKVIIKMMTERDLRNQMAYAKREAIAEGRAEGLVEGRNETIRQLLNAGVAPELMSAVLGLTGEEIARLK